MDRNNVVNRKSTAPSVRASIRSSFLGATFIQLWRMRSAEEQQAWLDVMHQNIHLLQVQRGFRSMSLHPSLDGRNVIVYAGVPRIDVSALTGAGLDGLRAHLKSSMGYFTLESGSVSARQRHLEALARAQASVEEAARVLKETRAGELVAQELREAQRALDEISGEFTNEDLLGRIFSSFCIGK